MALLSDQQKSDEKRQVRRKKCPVFLGHTHKGQAAFILFLSFAIHISNCFYICVWKPTQCRDKNKQANKQKQKQTNAISFYLGVSNVTLV